MKKTGWILVIGLLLLLSACYSPQSENTNEKVELTVSAASSMVNALEQIGDQFERENESIEVLFNLGSSGALGQQIVQGAPVDLYMSAAQDKFDVVLNKQLIDENYYTNLLGNELVLIQSTNTDMKINAFDDLLNKKIKTIAIGTPETVPAGNYGKQTLETKQLYQKLEKKLVQTKDVRQVLHYVETGSVEAGLVYKTDAMQSDSIYIVATANERNHAPIIYPVGVLKDAPNHKQAVLFYKFLKSEQAIEIFEEYGFTALRDEE